MQGNRVEPDPNGHLPLHEGDYGHADDVWWIWPPAGRPTVVQYAEEHNDGTISAEFLQSGKKYRIDHGVWQPQSSG